MEDAELYIHDEASYKEAVNKIDGIFDQLYGIKKKVFRDPNERNSYICSIMKKVEML